MTEPITQLRGAGLQNIAQTAGELRRTFVDVVTDTINFAEPNAISVGYDGTSPEFTVANGEPTRRAHQQLATRAGVPKAFYDRLTNDHTELWRHTMRELYPAGPSLFRCRTRDGARPVIRAALSDRYQIIDNVDVLTTVLQAFDDAGLGPNELRVHGDLDADDGLLRLRCVVPQIGVAARELLADYKSPYTGQSGADAPMVFAGIEVSNNETGGGKVQLLPRAEIQVCSNGMTRKADAFSKVHLGSKLDEGVIGWSDETRHKQLEFIASAVRDAVTTFISPEYLTTVINEALVAKGHTVTNPQASITELTKQAQLSDEEAERVLSHWLASGDNTVHGLAQAVTSTAQLVDDSDRQSELEQEFWNIVENVETYATA